LNVFSREEEKAKKDKAVASKRRLHATRRDSQTEENAETKFLWLCAAVSSVWPTDTVFPEQAAHVIPAHNPPRLCALFDGAQNPRGT